MVGFHSARNQGNTAHTKNRITAVSESGPGRALGRHSIRGIAAGEESAG